jgi:hypothetical protein
MSYLSNGLAMAKKLMRFFFPPKPESTMPSYARLNFSQKGVLQAIFSVSVSIIFFIVGEIVLIDIYKAGIFSQTMQKFIIIITIAVVVSLLTYIVMELSVKLNIVFGVTIPMVIEFSHALKKLQLFEFEKQIEFVSNHKIPLFVAKISIYPYYKDNVRVKMFINLKNKEKLKLYNGDQRLCLNIEDFERIIEEDKKRFSLAESVALMEKEEELRSFKEVIASLTNDKNRLEIDLTQLRKETTKLRNTVQMQPAQANSRVDRLRMERLQWIVLIPTMEKLIREAPSGKKYTMPELEAAFAEAWAQRADLQEQMRKLLMKETESTPSKDVTTIMPSEAMMKAVKADFKEAGLFSAGGHPRTPEVRSKFFSGKGKTDIP